MAATPAGMGLAAAAGNTGQRLRRGEKGNPSPGGARGAPPLYLPDWKKIPPPTYPGAKGCLSFLSPLSPQLPPLISVQPVEGV